MADDKTAEPTMTRQTTPFLLFLSSAISGTRSVQEVADGRMEWHGAIALSYEICRGLTSLWSVIPRRSRGSLAVRRWRRSQARTFLQPF